MFRALGGFLADHALGPSINPVEFFNARARERRDMLLAALPAVLTSDDIAGVVEREGLAVRFASDKTPPDKTYVDLSIFEFDEDGNFLGHGLEVTERLRKAVAEHRHAAGQTVTRLKKSLEQDRHDLPAGASTDDFSDFNLETAVNELTAAKAEVSEHEADQRRIVEMRANGKAIVDEIATLEERIAKLKERLEENNAAGLALKEKIEGFTPKDTTAMQQRIDRYRASLKYASAVEAITRKEKELAGAEAEHGALDNVHVALVDEIPRTLISRMEIPVGELELRGDDIFIDGKALDNLSEAERLLLGLNIARNLAGDLKVICIDGFEAVRKRLRKVFEEATADDGFEYFIAEATDDPLTVTGADEIAVESHP